MVDTSRVKLLDPLFLSPTDQAREVEYGTDEAAQEYEETSAHAKGLSRMQRPLPIEEGFPSALARVGRAYVQHFPIGLHEPELTARFPTVQTPKLRSARSQRGVLRGKFRCHAWRERHDNSG
jgi:hypothetical protein